MKIARPLAILFGLSTLVGENARAQLLFSDNFTSGTSAQWGNEVGVWTTTSGVYYATAPNNLPATYTSLPFTLTDFSVTMTINSLSDGGIWLRSANNANGILLVTGGNTRTGTGLYWHEIQGGVVSAPLDVVSGLFATNPVSTPTIITVTVIGDTYSAYVNGSLTPATTLTSSLFASGKVALYDFCTYPAQTFDNISLAAIPEPADFALLLGGLALLVGRWVKRSKS